MKTPLFRPNHREAEAAALGCALRGDDAASFLATVPQDFFATSKHRALHEAIKAALARQDGLDFVVLREVLLKAGKWTDSEKDNGELVTMPWLNQILENAPPAAQIKAYIRLLAQACRQRRLVREAEKIVDRANKRFLTVEELDELESAWQQSAFIISTGQENGNGLRPIAKIMSEAMKHIAACWERRLSTFGITSGFRKLDGLTTGFHPGELIIVAGRPSMGKTSFGLAVALNAVKEAPVAFFSLEMSEEQIGQRLLAREAAVNIRNLKAGQLQTQHDLDRVVEACGNLSEHSLFIDDSSTVTPAQVRFRVREIAIKTKNRVGLVIVDYLQIMSPGRKFDSREREVSSISREMKQLAKDLNCPVIVLSQLNRDLERRPDKRPILADLRESGAIEQDADVAIFLFRPYPYTDKDEDYNKAEAIIAKQRNGPVGTIDLRWEPTTASFWDV